MGKGILFYFMFVFIILFSPIFSEGQSSVRGGSAGRIFEVKAGKTVMKISAQGGRIISFRMRGKEFMTRQSEHENFGSTFWDAPQSNWGWPPYRVLDSQDYSVEKIGNTLIMTSQPDYKSGFQFEKRFRAGDSHFIRIEYRIRNISGEEKRVGPWEVTRVPCGGLAFFPDGGQWALPESKLKPDLRKDGVNWIMISKKPDSEHRKLFSTASEGWLAYAFQRMLFIKQFTDTQPENYSPRQGEVEIYVNKEKRYTELENHGAYQVLKPGESLGYVVNWGLVTIPETVKVEAGSRDLASFARQQFKNQLSNN